MIAALYVIRGGPYYGIDGVDPWDEARDARLYPGPHPVVAHPPCARWGRFWYGSPSDTKRFQLGDDGGCFAAALLAVQQYGGILEHPQDSQAWSHFNIPWPDRAGGWLATPCGGWTCRVEQGHYGHQAKKATWLYAVGPKPPEMLWGPSQPVGLSRMTTIKQSVAGKLSKRQRAATPIPFRDWLLNYARSV